MIQTFKLDPASPTPLHHQLVDHLRRSVVDGRLKPGDRIPSATDLAAATGLSRPTVVRALAEVKRAGLIVARVGRGSFVADPVHATMEEEASESRQGTLTEETRESSSDIRRLLFRLRLNHMTAVQQIVENDADRQAINLRAGAPSGDELPADLLPRLADRAFAHYGARLHQYAFRGIDELAEALAKRLNRCGYDVSPDRLLITSGAQEAVTFLGTWAAHVRRSVICETPTFWGVPQSLAFCGHLVRSVQWDLEANDLINPERAIPDVPSLLYCCPDFQNPTGLSLGYDSRHRLAEIARTRDLIVAVDDIFRDLRFDGADIPSLYHMLPRGRRILVGSLSKSFLAGLRIGFLAADAPLFDELAEIKRYLDLGGPPITQAMAERFLTDGYDEHLVRVRRVYRGRRDAACDALERHMPDDVHFTRPDGGFHMWVRLPRPCSAMRLYADALTRGVAISPGPMHDIDAGYADSVRLSYPAATESQIHSASQILAELVRNQMSGEGRRG